MASATASMVTSFLNVYAEAFTTMVYRRYIHPRASEGQMVRAGRIVTVILGGMVIAGALIIPRIGYASYIIKITALLTVPLAGPTVWGLFSRKIGIKTIWCVTWVGFASALVVQFGLCAGGWLAGIAFLDPLARLVQSNQEVANLAVGIATPLVLLTILELLAKHPHPGWEAVRRARPDMAGALTPPAMSRLPVVMVGITLAVLGLVMAVLACMDRHGRGILALFALVQCSISTVMFVVARRERGEH
jgi:Na+/proline symporter